MVNRLSELADFLENDSLPLWLKEMVKKQRQEITRALDEGQSFTLTGPDGERITIAAKHTAAAA